jgi:putative zinc finger/helix-turn-helix YgiT family protein
MGEVMMDYCPKCNEITEYAIKEKQETYPVKGTDISINAKVAVCNTCKTEIFNKELDAENLNIAFSVYRKAHKLLFPEEIARVRNKYSLSQRALGKLLEWGEITISRYESGAMQDPAHNEVLLFIDDPHNMAVQFDRTGHLLSESVRKRLKQRIEELNTDDAKHSLMLCVENFLNSEETYTENTGFSKFNLERMINLILYAVAKSEHVFETKLNKLLWYCDFLYFKIFSVPITGCVYKHLPLGPVPDNYKLLFGISKNEGLEEEEFTFESGMSGTRYYVNSEIDSSFFSEQEKKIIDYVIEYFKDYNCDQIKNKSHEEDGYKKTGHTESISYRYSSTLSIDLKK